MRIDTKHILKSYQSWKILQNVEIKDFMNVYIARGHRKELCIL